MERRGVLLTAKEREFIEDWLKVLDGRMEKIDFFRKWSTKKGNRNFLDDYLRVKKGEMTLEEFREKWTKKGEWRDYINVLKYRLRKKYRKSSELREKLEEEIGLLEKFFSLDEFP